MKKVKPDDNQQKLEGKLVESLGVKELGGLAAQYTEVGLDSVLDEGLIKDIPILRTLVSIAKVGLNIRDRLYVKKLVLFLVQAGSTTEEQRKAFIEKHCQNTNRFEEAVFLILEQTDNVEKSTLIGKIFKACVLGKITLEDAFVLCSMVNKTLWQDLESMFNGNYTDEIKNRLAYSGLLNINLARTNHIDETEKPAKTFETVNGFTFAHNTYSKMLLGISKMK